MKIAVYAICRNEINNIDAWYNSMSEADEIVVLDTGSTDNSIEKLKDLPKIKIDFYEVPRSHFRFDDARQRSLNLVSDDVDVCICTDLDMTLSEGWSHVIRDLWTKDSNRFIIPMTRNGKPYTCNLDRIHKRHGFYWKYPIFEHVEPIDGNPDFQYIPDIICNVVKTKPNVLHDEKYELYSRLLKLRIEEFPDEIASYRCALGYYESIFGKTLPENDKTTINIFC